MAIDWNKIKNQMDNNLTYSFRRDKGTLSVEFHYLAGNSSELIDSFAIHKDREDEIRQVCDRLVESQNPQNLSANEYLESWSRMNAEISRFKECYQLQ